MQKLEIKKSEYILYGFISDGSYIIPPHYQPEKFKGDGIIWLLPYE